MWPGVKASIHPVHSSIPSRPLCMVHHSGRFHTCSCQNGVHAIQVPTLSVECVAPGGQQLVQQLVPWARTVPIIVTNEQVLW